VTNVARRLQRAVSGLHEGGGEEGAFLVSNAIVNVANFGFFVAVARLFSPSHYGAISAILSIVTVANTPLNAIQAGVIHATVLVRHALGDPSPRRITTLFALVGSAVTVGGFALAPALERFFNVGTLLPLFMLALWFAPAVLNAALCGTLMGQFKFRVIAVANVAGAVTRIALVLCFGFAGHFLGLAGPVLATSVGIAVTAAWIFVPVRRAPAWRVGVPLVLHLRQTLWAFISLAGFAAFVALDIVLARHQLPGITAGNYAVASTAGKIALFLSVAVPIVAYPRFTAHHAAGTSSLRELRLSLVLVVGLGALAAAVMALFPHLVIGALFGHRYSTAPALLRILAPEGAAMGAVGLFTYYHVARRSLYAAVPWFGVAVVTAWMSVGHLHARGLAVLMTASALVIAILMAIPALRDERPNVGRSTRGEPGDALAIEE
jgi:O-antigen/teichoic acid export membrane protein